MIRFSIACFGILFCIVLCTGSPAWADTQGNLRQKLFEMDKIAALAAFGANHQNACVSALQSRYQSRYTVSSALTFNESLSLDAYDRLFWKGQGSLHRGLLFSASVTNQSGAKAGNVICYYAMTDYRLDFQGVYVLLHTKETGTASREKDAIPASVLTFASGE